MCDEVSPKENNLVEPWESNFSQGSSSSKEVGAKNVVNATCRSREGSQQGQWPEPIRSLTHGAQLLCRLPSTRHAEIIPQARGELDRPKRGRSLQISNLGEVSPRGNVVALQPPVNLTGISSPADNAHSLHADPRLLSALGRLISLE